MDSVFVPYLERIEKTIKESLPRTFDRNWMESSFGMYATTVVKEEHISPLVNPVRDLVDLGGKRWRPLFLVLTAEAELLRQKKSLDDYQDIISNAYHLTPLVEFIHTASLIHDDIEDSSESRRGKPAAYITYGLDTAINAGSWLYFEAASVIDSLEVSSEMRCSLYSAYSLELRKLHLGQAMDIYWHANPSLVPSREEYLTMVKNKTGTLSSLACKAGALIAGADEDTILQYSRIASDIGAGFQILDDVINLTTGNPGKKRGDDIVEGKKSLIVLTYVNSHGKDSSQVKELEECFVNAKRDGINSPYVEKAVSMLEKDGIIRQSKEQGIFFIEKGLKSFEDLMGKDNKAVNKIKTLFTSMIPKNI